MGRTAVKSRAGAQSAEAVTIGRQVIYTPTDAELALDSEKCTAECDCGCVRAAQPGSQRTATVVSTEPKSSDAVLRVLSATLGGHDFRVHAKYAAKPTEGCWSWPSKVVESAAIEE